MTIRRWSRHTTLALVIASSPAALLLWACLEPTQITLRIDTDVECAVLVKQGGTAIIGGQASSDPITTTTACEGAGATRSIGTLVLTPSADREGLVTLAIVAGVTRPLDQCVDKGFEGCVVARRRLRFVPHEPVELPVRISRACVGVRCGDDQTCVEGNCATADVEDPAFCTSGQNCGTPPVTPPVTNAADAAVNTDAAANTDADAGTVGTGDASFELFVDGQQAYGISANTKALYWTEDLPANAGMNRRLWQRRWGQDASDQPKDQDDQAGLAATNNELAVAGFLAGSAAGNRYTVLADGGLELQAAFGITSGTKANTVAWLGSELVWNDDNKLRMDSGTLNSPIINVGSYIESDRDAAAVFWASGGAVTRTTITPDASTNNADGGVLPPEAGDIVGIAVGEKKLFLSTANGDIFSLAPSGTAKRLGNVPQAQDLVVWADNLYVAGGGGIYVRKAVE